MICPKCGSSTKVCDTRYDEDENEIFRRRVCKNENCSKEFFTIEFEIEKNDNFSAYWKTLSRGVGSREIGPRNNE